MDDEARRDELRLEQRGEIGPHLQLQRPRSRQLRLAEGGLRRRRTCLGGLRSSDRQSLLMELWSVDVQSAHGELIVTERHGDGVQIVDLPICASEGGIDRRGSCCRYASQGGGGAGGGKQAAAAAAAGIEGRMARTMSRRRSSAEQMMSLSIDPKK